MSEHPRPPGIGGVSRTRGAGVPRTSGAGGSRISGAGGPPAARDKRVWAMGALTLLAVAAIVLGLSWPRRGASVTPAAHKSGAGVPLAVRSGGDKPARPAGLDDQTRFFDPHAAGHLAYEQGDLEESLARFQAAISRNPLDAESMSNAAQVLVRLGRAEEALPLLLKAVTLNPQRWTYRFNLARAHATLGQWDGAVEEYRSASKLFPNDYATRFNLGQALHKTGKEEEAVAEYQKAIELAPAEPTFHLALALSQEKLGRTAEAIATYRRALELQPDAPDGDQVRAHIRELEVAGSGPGQSENPEAQPPQVADKKTTDTQR
jgi:Tfp pilus assembly protein PilF